MVTVNTIVRILCRYLLRVESNEENDQRQRWTGEGATMLNDVNIDVDDA